MTISLITARELQAARLIERDALTIVDTRDPEDFADGHIPDAVRVGWEQWCEQPERGVKEILTTPGYWGKLADPEKANFAERLAALGVRSDSHIVVYAAGKSSKGRDGRLAWMFAYLGAKKVSILDGGLNDWMRQELPVEATSEKITRGKFEIKLDKSRRCLVEDLEHKLVDESAILIDTRSPMEHQGLVYWYQPRMGRIPGSRLVPFVNVYKEESDHFVSADDYAKLLPEKRSSGKMVATYCEVGVRAATVSLLHEIYTGEILPVYDGSMMEWSFGGNRPVERGAYLDR